MKVEKDKIIIENLNDFKIDHILLCGQIFRYKKLKDAWQVFTGGNTATIKMFADRAEIYTNNTSFFIDFFDLNTNYSQIKQQLCQDDFLREAIAFGCGIRVLNQSPLEMIISFIISANNNIPRIQNIIERLCTLCGTKMEGYYAFPTLQQLLNADESLFKNIGAGYRSAYLVNTIKKLNSAEFNIEKLKKMDDIVLKNQLQKLNGVGPKVADCIMLFGFKRTEFFPVDVWIEKVYKQNFKGAATSRLQIANFFVDRYKKLSGYAQQYLYFFKRSKSD